MYVVLLRNDLSFQYVFKYSKNEQSFPQILEVLISLQVHLTELSLAADYGVYH